VLVIGTNFPINMINPHVIKTSTRFGLCYKTNLPCRLSRTCGAVSLCAREPRDNKVRFEILPRWRP
jgi:hypothetical protein